MSSTRPIPHEEGTRQSDRILIVEDEAIIAMDLRNQLEKFGYRVVATVSSGEQAIQLANEHIPQLVLMDIVLQGSMDGITTAAIIEKHHIPVIFLTAFSDAKTIERAKMVGASSFLIKPFRPSELNACVAVALHKSHLEQAQQKKSLLFAKALENEKNKMIVTNPQGFIVFMNPEAERITGCQFQQMKGTLITDLISLMDDVNQAISENSLMRLLNRVDMSEANTDYLLVTVVGNEHQLKVSATPLLDADGVLLGTIFVLNDNALPRQVEALTHESGDLFHSAFEYSDIGLALFTDDGQFSQINPALCHLLGYSKEELLPMTLQQLAFDQEIIKYDDRFYQAIWSTVQEVGLWRGKIKLTCKSGKDLSVALAINAVPSSAGKILSYIGSFTDITEQKKIEYILQKVLAGKENQLEMTQEKISSIREETVSANTTIDVLLKHREKDIFKANARFSSEMEEIVIPFMDKLKATKTDKNQARLIEIIDANLKTVMQTYGHPNETSASLYRKLTPVEAKVATMIQKGYSTKLIATTLNISAGTVDNHRKHIRKKLGIQTKATNLQSYLKSIGEA